jgi:hypothetical protein
MRVRLTAIFFLAFALGGPVYGQDVAAAKRAELERLLALTGALNIGQQMSTAMVQQITNMLRASNPDLSPRAIQVLQEEVNGVIGDNMGAFKELMILVYDRHYTLDDVRGLNQFYASDLGRKVTGTLPAIVQESMMAGQKWGQSLGPEIQRRIQARFRKEKIDT